MELCIATLAPKSEKWMQKAYCTPGQPSTIFTALNLPIGSQQNSEWVHNIGGIGILTNV